MNKAEKSDQFDLEALRKQVSDIKRRAEEADEEVQPEPINTYARQIAEQFSAGNRSPAIIIGQLRLFEFATQFLIGLLAFPFWPGNGAETLSGRGITAAIVAVLLVCALQTADTYSIPALRARMRLLPRVFAVWTSVFLIVIAGSALSGNVGLGQAQAYLAWFVTGAIFLLAARFLIAYGIRNWSRNGIMERRAVIVGGGEPAKNLIRVLEQQADNDIRICGIFDDRGEKRSPIMVAGYPKLGTVAELVEFVRITRIDMLIISLPLSAEARILQLLKKLWVLPVDIRLAAHANRLRFRPRAYSRIGSVPMLDIFNKPIRDWDSVAKRCFDIFFTLLSLALLWPVMLATAIAIKLTSKGPVFFMQNRHGFNNEIINIFKFRSMYADKGDPTGRAAVTKGDPRVTPVGRFIRKSSIDELPQLFNVLKGDLSLVGPRPHAILAQARDRAFGDVVEGYFARHRVKPGVTGWAQINGWRGEVDHDDKIKFRTAYDLYYIENWSLWFDLKILFLTPFRLFNTENAY
ncbi:MULTISPECIES: undecaprenyl-phosphate glucose phosphotransferase [Rhizobium]|uniref:Exopolysaccharide biosynthesis polyprenyl glycosylphosphotransferase n=1 Tax=Rhizobium favelukesii TaxID=348824 RepID=W6R7A5_9HYPH|nr:MULTISPECIES: undecaprenyl-phosphate glucose phosphotransferase [Rhizobium]MCS0460820.1 undecaprenyl-phosphate glucose phosphotransferase [Rhizobium favelukesii]UFS81170.1 undecaprenyl-phosphate glucose phosphotransferase [Rhizobium sp. T136]CDM57162.1 exopolysaccharide biosynthesis polyprenyl glycosylphosphotransferase [Rhizobium favelukesii]